MYIQPAGIDKKNALNLRQFSPAEYFQYFDKTMLIKIDKTILITNIAHIAMDHSHSSVKKLCCARV